MPENRIKELRKQRGLSQEELGAEMKADLTGSTVAKLENGRQMLTVRDALDIANILEVSLPELLGLDDTTETITNDRLLAEMRVIQKTLTHDRDHLDRITSELRSLKAHISGLIESGLRQEHELNSLRLRIEHIESHLERNDTAPFQDR